MKLYIHLNMQYDNSIFFLKSSIKFDPNEPKRHKCTIIMLKINISEIHTKRIYIYEKTKRAQRTIYIIYDIQIRRLKNRKRLLGEKFTTLTFFNLGRKN